jgi:two-component system, sporulation sensor kinase E
MNVGLAVCYSIAARHGAEIEFKTSPKGTTFYVKFDIYKNFGISGNKNLTPQ